MSVGVPGSKITVQYPSRKNYSSISVKPKKKRNKNEIHFPSISINIMKIWPDCGSLYRHCRTCVFLWESDAENSPARSLCLTLLRGHKGLSGGPLLLLYHCGWGRQGGRDPRRALLSPLQALLQTHGCILRDTYRRTQTAVGHTRLGRTVWRNETVWKGLMASERQTRGDKDRKTAERRRRRRRSGWKEGSAAKKMKEREI